MIKLLRFEGKTIEEKADLSQKYKWAAEYLRLVSDNNMSPEDARDQIETQKYKVDSKQLVQDIKSLERYNKQQVNKMVELAIQAGASDADIKYIRTVSNVEGVDENQLKRNWWEQEGNLTNTRQEINADPSFLEKIWDNLDPEDILKLENLPRTSTTYNFWIGFNIDVLKAIIKYLRPKFDTTLILTKADMVHQIIFWTKERRLSTIDLSIIGLDLQHASSVDNVDSNNLHVLQNSINTHWPTISKNGVWSEIFNRLDIGPEKDLRAHNLDYVHSLGHIAQAMHHVEREEPVPLFIYNRFSNV